jgi:hypothetical protein
MRRNDKVDPRQKKEVARQKYAERQISKFVKWSWCIKGKVRSRDIKDLQDEYNIKCYTKINYKD